MTEEQNSSVKTKTKTPKFGFFLASTLTAVVSTILFGLVLSLLLPNLTTGNSGDLNHAMSVLATSLVGILYYLLFILTSVVCLIFIFITIGTSSKKGFRLTSWILFGLIALENIFSILIIFILPKLM
jgi:fumarate reductase subunit D